jgi:YhgE/Pip-like protein
VNPQQPTDARASHVLRAPSAWLPPLVLVALLVLTMTLVYFGSVVNPTGHLHGLPVAVVNDDAGVTAGGRRVNLGDRIAAALTGAPAVTSRLALRVATMHDATGRMDVGKEFAAVVIPSGLTAALLAHRQPPPAIELLTNPRAGNLGVSLATGVLSPALDEIRQHLPGPVGVTVVPYRPLPSHTALGLSAFYISLLTIFCGFLGAVVVHASVDAVLGYAPTEIGPMWRQRPLVRISRVQTLLAKWAIAVPLALVLTGIMLGAAILVLGMDDPHFWELWLLAWFAAAVVAIGTLVLFAALGTLGQLAALLVFVYLALASSGGTVPLQALSGFFRFLANFEPLRQVLDGVRAILYFDGSGEAGLTRALVASSIGLVFWLAVGAAVTIWYDRRGLDRLPATEAP